MNRRRDRRSSRAAAAIIVTMMLIAGSCVTAWASVSAYTKEAADFYPGRTGITIPGFDEWLSQSDSGTGGVATTSYNYPGHPGGTVPPSGSGGVDTATADKCYSTYAYVNESAGILKAYASTGLMVKGAMIPSININSHATAEAEIRDSVTLSAPATLTLTGSMDGSLGGSSNRPNYDVFEEYIWTPMSVEAWVSFSYNVPGEEASVNQGFSVFYDTAGHKSDSFCVPIDLPAHTPVTVSCGLTINANVDPDTSTILGVGWTERVDPLSTITGSIWADFASTMSFDIGVPEGVDVTSESGLLPLHSQAVPEPSSLLALCSGLGLVAGFVKRRR